MQTEIPNNEIVLQGMVKFFESLDTVEVSTHEFAQAIRFNMTPVNCADIALAIFDDEIYIFKCRLSHSKVVKILPKNKFDALVTFAAYQNFTMFLLYKPSNYDTVTSRTERLINKFSHFKNLTLNRGFTLPSELHDDIVKVNHEDLLIVDEMSFVKSENLSSLIKTAKNTSKFTNDICAALREFNPLYDKAMATKLQKLHYLCCVHELNYTIDYCESSNEFDITAGDYSNNPDLVVKSGSLDITLDRIIEKLEKY